jgi:hypothetical protein
LPSARSFEFYGFAFIETKYGLPFLSLRDCALKAKKIFNFKFLMLNWGVRPLAEALFFCFLTPDEIVALENTPVR